MKSLSAFRHKPPTTTTYELPSTYTVESVRTLYLQGLASQDLCVEGNLLIEIQPNLFGHPSVVTIRARVVSRKEF